MGNIVVAYVQTKNHFTEQPNLSASRARLTTRSLPICCPTAEAVSAPLPHTSTTALPDRAAMKMKQTCVADETRQRSDRTSRRKLQQAHTRSAATSAIASDERRVVSRSSSSSVSASSALLAETKYLPEAFLFTLPGGGWGDASRGTWHASDRPWRFVQSARTSGCRGEGVGRPCDWLPTAHKLTSWSRRDPMDAPRKLVMRSHSTFGDTREAGTEEGVSSSASATRGGVDEAHRDCPRHEPHSESTLSEDENESALLGTMDCADAHTCFFPLDTACETLDSATFRHPHTLWLRPTRDLRDAYVHGQGKYRPASAVRADTGARGAVPAFVGIAEELRRMGEQKADVLVISWRHVDRVARTSPIETSYYMGVPQYMTCGALSAHIQALRLGLRSLGLVAGDGIALMERSRWEWLVTCYAAWSLGLVVTVFHDDPQCVEQMVCEAAENLKCIVCAAPALPSLRRHLREREVRQHEREKEQAAARRAAVESVTRCTPSPAPAVADGNEYVLTSLARVRALPKPLFIVMPSDDGAHSEAAASNVRGGSMQAGAQVRESDAARHARHHEEEDEEEALWWLDVLKAGRAVLYNVAVCLAHEQRLRGRPHPRRLTYSRCARVEPTALALIVYTEGDCRGVLLTHGALRAAVTAHAEYLQETGLIPSESMCERATAARRADLPCVDTNEGDEEDSEDIWASRAQPSPGDNDNSDEEAMEAEKARVEDAVIRRLAEQSGVSGEAADYPSTPTTLSGHSGHHPAGRHAAPLSASSATARLARVLLAALHGDVRSSTTEALSGFQAWWQQQQAVVRSHLSLYRGVDGGGGGATGGGHSGDDSRAERPSYVLCGPLHRIRELVFVSTLLLRTRVMVCFGRPETLLSGHSHHHHHYRVYPCSDVKLYKPLVLCLEPAMLEALRGTVQSSVQHPGYASVLFNEGYRARRSALRRGMDTPYLNSSVFTQTRQLLGGRCRLVISHGALLSPRVQEYVQVVCGTAVVQWYTLTEACGCGLAQLPWDGALHCVGGPMGVLEMRLRDVSRLGLLWPCDAPTFVPGHGADSSRHNTGGDSDEHERAGSQRQKSTLATTAAAGAGRPSTSGSGHGSRPGRARYEASWWLHDDTVPAGELLLRGASLFSGYHAQPERTVATLDRDGWLHTGDVLESVPTNQLGWFRVVDRLHTRAKTAAACVVELARHEALYRQHLICDGDDVCVLVHPFSDLVVALVVTSEARARSFHRSSECQKALQRLADDSTRASPLPAFMWPDVLGDTRFNAAVGESFYQWGLRHGLPHETCVRRVRLVYDDWTPLRTATGKLRREAISRCYGPLIQELFRDSTSPTLWRE